MNINIIESSAHWVPQIRAMNRRMEKGGSEWKFFESVKPAWLPPEPGESLERRYYIAVDLTTASVHGGYVLKRQPFQIGSKSYTVANVQGPVSEGLVDRTYKMLGPMMIRDALARVSLQFSWGATERKQNLLLREGWVRFDVPILVDICRISVLLQSKLSSISPRFGQWLAHQPQLQKFLDTLFNAAKRIYSSIADNEQVEIRSELRFEDWADEVWLGSHMAYGLVAQRTSAALNRLMPAGSWPEAKPISIWMHGQIIGWAALRVQTNRHLFGLKDVKVGSVIDALALEGKEELVACAALNALRRLNPDISIIIFSDLRWSNAFKDAGCIRTGKTRALLISPLLAQINEHSEYHKRMHFTLIDGDGPLI